MSELPMQKKIFLGTLALGALLVPIIFGAAAQGSDEPRPIVRIAPNYPPEALAARSEGEVRLEFTIAANGSVKDVVVVDSSSPEFELPAVAALLKWRYIPPNVECVGTVCTPNPHAREYKRASDRRSAIPCWSSSSTATRARARSPSCPYDIRSGRTR